MKNRIKFYTFLIAVMYTLFSCENDDNSNSDNNQNATNQTIQIAQTGTWRIASFIDSGDNETSDFNGYIFTFNEDGTLNATNGTNTQNGIWSVTNDSSDNSSDDDGNSMDDDEDFNIFFPVPDSNDFEDLSEDWDVVSISATVISLIDDDGDEDTLTFTQN